MSRNNFRLKRLDDFNRRKTTQAADVLVVNDRNWEYIPVHPMANETEWLERHGLTASDCIRVDCYWNMNDDVVFLQVHSIKSGWSKPPGLYARWDEKGLPMIYIDAVIEEPFITRSEVEDVMGKIEEIHRRRNIFTDGRIGQQLTRLR